jgi:hypothetical protein
MVVPATVALSTVGIVLVATSRPDDGPGRPTATAEAVTTAPASSVQPTAAAAGSSVASAPQGSALAALRTLRTAGRGPMTGYSRAQFGPAWADTDRNGCDTRNDILRRDLVGVTIKPGTHGCVVLTGTLHDPYTATTIQFVRGGASETDIDHVVALGDAWVTGAARWPYAKRIALANDPLNLLAVQSRANRQKGDGDAATWLPSNKAYRCAYVARQVSVKHKFGLSVTPPERAAMERALSSCPGQHLVTGGNPVLSTVTPPATPATGNTVPTPRPGGASGVYYASCAAARAAGAAPLHQGQPGYRPGLDRDHDGVACE